MMWILILSLIGVVLNIKKKRICFLIWMITNLSWCIVDFHKGIPAQGCLFGVYFLLAIWGWMSWRKKRGIYDR